MTIEGQLGAIFCNRLGASPNIRPASRDSAMSEHRERLAGRIKAFVENPVTRLVEGVLLLLIGLTDASRTIWDDFTQAKVRVGHGLIIIGIFSILRSLPRFIEGLDASTRYLELREEKAQARKGTDTP